MSERITSTVYGIAPWSDELLGISGDIGRGRKTQEDYAAQFSADFGLYSGVLEASGIDYRSGDWGGGSKDYLRDIAQLFSGLRESADSAPVTRWFDTNTFYRQPAIEGFVGQPGAYPHQQYKDWLKLTGSDATYQPTFLSPYALAKLSSRGSETTELNAFNFARFAVEQLIAASTDKGINHIILNEPFIPYSASSTGERAKFVDAVEEITQLHADLSLGLFFGYGDASPIINDVLEREVPVAAIGCDLQKTPLSKVGPVGRRIFLAGLVDGANTLLRPEEELARETEATLRAQPEAEVSVTHTVDLEHVPRRYAIQKIKQIGQVAALIKGDS